MPRLAAVDLLALAAVRGPEPDGAGSGRRCLPSVAVYVCVSIDRPLRGRGRLGAVETLPVAPSERAWARGRCGTETRGAGAGGRLCPCGGCEGERVEQSAGRPWRGLA